MITRKPKFKKSWKVKLINKKTGEISIWNKRNFNSKKGIRKLIQEELKKTPHGITSEYNLSPIYSPSTKEKKIVRDFFLHNFQFGKTTSSGRNFFIKMLDKLQSISKIELSTVNDDEGENWKKIQTAIHIIGHEGVLEFCKELKPRDYQ